MYADDKVKVHTMPVTINTIVEKLGNDVIQWPADIKPHNIVSNFNFVENILLNIVPNDLLFEIKDDKKIVVRAGFITLTNIYYYVYKNCKFYLRFKDNLYTDFENLDDAYKDYILRTTIRCTFIRYAEDGDILKITSRDHFLGRKETELDNPIKSHQKVSPESFCHYYTEEKTTSDINSKDIDSFVERADKMGYTVVDRRFDQFGKTKDGRVVIIDPECIRKKGILSLLNYKLNKVKAYAKIIMK
jgi:hypothetical protein